MNTDPAPTPITATLNKLQIIERELSASLIEREEVIAPP